MLMKIFSDMSLTVKICDSWVKKKTQQHTFWLPVDQPPPPPSPQKNKTKKPELLFMTNITVILLYNKVIFSDLIKSQHSVGIFGSISHQ